MAKELYNTLLIWGFLVFSLFAAIYLSIDIYTKINQVQESEGIYTFVCPNGSIINFTVNEPAYLCKDLLNPNPIYNHTKSFNLTGENT